MESSRTGALAALGAFLCWGVFGLYFHALGAIPAPEVLAHRILGGALSALLVLTLARRLGEVRAILAERRMVLGLGASALAIAVNWGAFIWSVANGHALEASLGYFLFPLVSVVLARVVLGELLTGRQRAAVLLCALGVGWMILRSENVPWMALTLAVSFGAYGLLRKTIAVPALAGLFVETAWLIPLALAYLAWAGGGVAPGLGGGMLALLALAGPVTAVPLVLFAFGARRLRLSTLGLMMYINPTVQMVVAVLVLGEAFTSVHAVTFAAIWAGLVLYSWPKRTATG